MKVAEIRTKFIEYFSKVEHSYVKSSSLIPANDKTLLFTNAGMVPFKDIFLGQELPKYPRVTTIQKCLRAGGKHNDLENVGYTARHHTFFEMLGNFSFGNYFKKEAIHYTWEFLTQVLGLPAERLWVTVHEKDEQAKDIWLNDVKIDASRFSRLGDADNFWSMADVGPCGYCSEVFYDHGPDVAGGPPGSVDAEGDRYVEIWNMVFMEYNRDLKQNMQKLPNPSIDTGMGLERIAAVLQGVHSNYDIDIFAKLINNICQVLGVANTGQKSLQVIADHVRAIGFLLVDGVRASNEGRGYVLRRIMRRAIRHGHKLGQETPFLAPILRTLPEIMGPTYPELQSLESLVALVTKEEEQFFKTLAQGMRLLAAHIIDLKGTVLPGTVVFQLYDTYGFPPDLTADIIRERNLSIDELGFAQCMQQQQQQSKQASNFSSQEVTLDVQGHTEFSGYTNEVVEQCQVLALFDLNGQARLSLDAGEEGLVILNKTPFYAESGGQQGDTGTLDTKNSSFKVLDTTKQRQAFVHRGQVTSGALKVGQEITARINSQRRAQIKRHHSATHLFHAALRQVLGEHVVQKGSLVTPWRARFDFAHYQALTTVQIAEVEQLVNDVVLQNTVVEQDFMSADKAMASGAMALFDEKYGDVVRVLSMGDGFSKELCGGTHVERTGSIGFSKIISESGVAAGVRRIEFVCGEAFGAYLAQNNTILGKLSGQLGVSAQDLPDKTRELQQSVKTLSQQIVALEQLKLDSLCQDLCSQATDFSAGQLVVAKVSVNHAQDLRYLADKLRDKLPAVLICLGAVIDEKVALLVASHKSLSKTYHCGKLIKLVAAEVGGKGGGRPDLAQAGGTQPEGLTKAFEAFGSAVAQLS